MFNLQQRRTKLFHVLEHRLFKRAVCSLRLPRLEKLTQKTQKRSSAFRAGTRPDTVSVPVGNQTKSTTKTVKFTGKFNWLQSLTEGNAVRKDEIPKCGQEKFLNKWQEVKKKKERLKFPPWRRSVSRRNFITHQNSDVTSWSYFAAAALEPRQAPPAVYVS